MEKKASPEVPCPESRATTKMKLKMKGFSTSAA